MPKRSISCLALAVVAALTLVGCPAGQPTPGQSNPPAGLSSPPAAPREFRAAWVASVENTDWPSRKTLSPSEQQAEIVAICDRAAALKLNCLIVQVRTSCDALYPSALEPWSVYLTGKQGVAPNPAYDPLAMWIAEAHRRGIEIHAWVNPYRARFSRANADVATIHVARRNPSIVKTYGPHLWLDPGEPAAAQQTLAVMDDIVRRYDVDGLHIDDYFYPYPIKDGRGNDVPFPDDASWQRYGRRSGLARNDWRRDNVNRMVKAIYDQTKRRKSWVKFGISPFGIGRPGKAPGIKGMDQYEQLYADAALWLRNGWCDYFVPQLYWRIDQPQQSFPVLYDYWRSENTRGRHVWAGLFTSKVGDDNRAYPPGEISQQISLTRQRSDPGHAHFSMKALQAGNADRAAMAEQLRSQTYANHALVPATPWLDNEAPAKPAATLQKSGDAVELIFAPGAGEPVAQFAIWRSTGQGWQFTVAPAGVRTIRLPVDTQAVVVSAVDRCGNESERVSLSIRGENE